MNHWLYRYVSATNVIKTMLGSKGDTWMTMQGYSSYGIVPTNSLSLGIVPSSKLVDR